MNKLVKRGFSVYKIFLKNKIASSIMMFAAGVMMLVGALHGRGNDTKTMPLAIIIVGAILAFWALYRLGYIKSTFDLVKDLPGKEKDDEKKILLLQILESFIYILIVAAGIFLLINEKFTNTVLNLMAGFFTTLNGVFGVINAVKGRENRDFRWKFMIVITIIELGMGPYFIFGSESISLNGYIVMGILTSLAGVIEMINSFTKENFRGTLNDGKKIVQIMKDDEETK